MTEWNFATAFEIVADTVGDAPALICGDKVRSWSEYDDRAARLACFLSDAGLGKESKVAILMHNSNEYLEAHHAIMKIRGCAININYRYKEDELIYVLENSDTEVLIFQDTYADIINAIRPRMKSVKCFVQVDVFGGIGRADGIYDYEQVIDHAVPMERINRAKNDIYMLYTGGTTGMPKGAMYSNGDLCQWFSQIPTNGGVHSEDFSQFSKGLLRMHHENEVPRSLVCSPLMHGTGLWIGAMSTHLRGGAACTISTLGLDADLLWKQAEKYRATFMTIVGDAFARPMLKALNEKAAIGQPYDLGNLERIQSSGVIFSQEVKSGILEHLDIELIDLVGATEGTMGQSVTTRGNFPRTGEFDLAENAKVFTEEGIEIKAGSNEAGLIAALSPMIGYYKDDAKTAKITKIIDGERWLFPGDYATIDKNGKLRFLGRGSGCINTGGEKVFPEEVEEVLKTHEAVTDCIIVGTPDERFNERIVAVLSCTEKNIAASKLIEFCKEKLSGYKCPREFVFVETVSRLPNGKADYKWAKNQVALSQSQ